MSVNIKTFESGITGYTFKSAFGGYSIIKNEHPVVFEELESILNDFKIQDTEVLSPGGNESVITRRLKSEFQHLDWHTEVIAHKTNQFEILKNNNVIDDFEGNPFVINTEAMSHKMDAFHNDEGGNIALEIEWNTRKEFLERDITAFQSLYDNGYINAAIIVTKSKELQSEGILSIFNNFFEANSPYNSIDDLRNISLSEITNPQARDISRLASGNKTWSQACAQVLVRNKFGGTHSHFGNLETLIERGKVKFPMLIVCIEHDSIEGDYV